MWRLFLFLSLLALASACDPTICPVEATLNQTLGHKGCPACPSLLVRLLPATQPYNSCSFGNHLVQGPSHGVLWFEPYGLCYSANCGTPYTETMIWTLHWPNCPSVNVTWLVESDLNGPFFREC